VDNEEKEESEVEGEVEKGEDERGIGGGSEGTVDAEV
jgi:hypothetical protein